MPLKTVLIIGPGSPEYTSLSNHEAYREKNNGLIIGDGTSPLSLSEIRNKLNGRIDSSTRIDAVMHSRQRDKLLLQIDNDQGEISTSDEFLTTLDNCSKSPLNVELRCCFAGLAENILKKGSSLISHTPEDQFFLGEPGTHSLIKLLDSHLENIQNQSSSPKSSLDQIADSLPLYTMNPIKISISEGRKKESSYTFRPPKLLLSNLKNVDRYLQGQMNHCHKELSSSLGDLSSYSNAIGENPPQISPISSEDYLDYIYGSITNETDHRKIVRDLNHLKERNPDSFLELISRNIHGHDLIAHAADSSQTEVVEFLIDTLVNNDVHDEQQARILLTHLSQKLIQMFKNEQKLRIEFRDSEVDRMIEDNEKLFKYLLKKLKHHDSFFTGEDTLFTYCIKQNHPKFTNLILNERPDARNAFAHHKNNNGRTSLDILIPELDIKRYKAKTPGVSNKAAKQRFNKYTQLLHRTIKSGAKLSEKNIYDIINCSNDEDLLRVAFSNSNNEPVLDAFRKKLTKDSLPPDPRSIDNTLQSIDKIKNLLTKSFNSISDTKEFASRSIKAALDADHTLLLPMLNMIKEPDIPEVVNLVINSEESIEKKLFIADRIFEYLNDKEGIKNETLNATISKLIQSEAFQSASNATKEKFVKLVPPEKRRNSLRDYEVSPSPPHKSYSSHSKR
ncbi:MAG: hypothetical protein N4A31_05310 [Rickettsiales bacterium]|jgi:hypothetical protein|nr:hypothetical protein [Rickettsiales bacterium]